MPDTFKLTELNMCIRSHGVPKIWTLCISSEHNSRESYIELQQQILDYPEKLDTIQHRIKKFLKEIEKDIEENYGNTSMGTEYVKIRLKTILGDEK